VQGLYFAGEIVDNDGLCSFFLLWESNICPTAMGFSFIYVSFVQGEKLEIMCFAGLSGAINLEEGSTNVSGIQNY
jgi:hypothetical protein